MAASDSSEGEEPVSEAASEVEEEAIPVPVGEPASKPTAEQAPPRLDPLLVSVTRMDDATKSAPTMNVPIWGEVILDKSLFVLLPVAAFAVLGFLSFIVVAANSGDAFINAMNENAMLKGYPTPTTEEGCRGLCSSQEQDLESLRTYMKAISGQK